jgi:response regulator of citrate/malate metabolism
MEGTDPFTLRKQEKTLNKMKQQKKELKNVENAQKNIKKSKQVKDTKHGKDLKLKNDKKGLEKTLETVQKSTASMGKFDKKIAIQENSSFLNISRLFILLNDGSLEYQ